MQEKKIESIVAKEILDSRQKSTIEVFVTCEGVTDSFSVPSGASTGIHEAHVLDTNIAIEKVNTIIAPALVGKNIFDQQAIDDAMIALDGTKNKENLGGNSMIGVSIACAKTAAKVSGMQTYEYLRTLKQIKSSRRVPYFYMNLVNGGKHAKSKLAFQEYHIVPIENNPELALKMGVDIKNSLKDIIFYNLGANSVVMGDEGGFAVQIADIRKPLEFLVEAISRNGLDGKVRLALDVASSSFYQNGKYLVGGNEISKEELMATYGKLISEFNLLSIEDPFDEEDFDGFAVLKSNHPKLIVVGDDLTVTNVNRLSESIQKGCVSGMIIKPNQVGTLSETLNTMALARENGIELIVSHRSGETMDTFIADLAYAFGVFGLKTGAPGPAERVSKYERLIEIHKEQK